MCVYFVLCVYVCVFQCKVNNCLPCFGYKKNNLMSQKTFMYSLCCKKNLAEISKRKYY